jgi:hypothetical protein
MYLYQKDGQMHDETAKLPEMAPHGWTKVIARKRPDAPWSDQREKILKDKTMWIKTRTVTKVNSQKYGTLISPSALNKALEAGTVRS